MGVNIAGGPVRFRGLRFLGSLAACCGPPVGHLIFDVEYMLDEVIY